VQVFDEQDVDLGRHDEMVEAVPAAPLLPLPAQLAALITVKVAERVPKAERLEALDQRQLGFVPARAAIGPQIPVACAGERPDASVGMLLARGVEVAAQRCWSLLSR
jgi:hypothetical protein